MRLIREILKISFGKERRVSLILWFLAFQMIYFIVDYLNMSYVEMVRNYGLYLVIINILINTLMALLGSLMIVMASVNFNLTAKDLPQSNASFIAILFGILTYGCTTCVITFFAAIGINFFVLALPLAGLPYKLFALLFLIVSFYFVLRSLNKSMCRINLETNE